MSDFKQCSKCEFMMNSLDDHMDCYQHRVCNVAFPCDVCSSWTSDKRTKIDKMIEKNLKKSTTSTATTVTESSNGEFQVVSQSPLFKAFRQSKYPFEYHKDFCQSELSFREHKNW